MGCVIVCHGELIAEGWNQKESLNDPTAHAELIALREAAHKLRSWRLISCTLYSTLEPCLMCAGAIIQARIPRVVYIRPDPKFGAHISCISAFSGRWNHRPVVEMAGFSDLGEEVEQLMRGFFLNLRRTSLRNRNTSLREG